MKSNYFNKIKSLFKKELNDSILTDSDSFCMMPWVHLHTTQLGTVTPCCQAPMEAEQSFGNINEQPLEEIWNGTEMRKFRQKLMNNTKDTRCTRCYNQEAVGLLSMRQVTNRAFQHKLDWVKSTTKNGYAPDAKPIYWDIRFSNLVARGQAPDGIAMPKPSA